MEYKQKAEWLGRYQRALRKQRYLEEELEMLRSDAERMTARLGALPGGGPDAGRLPRAVERLDEARKRLESQLESCFSDRWEINCAIGQVENPLAQEVLRRRYILGQSYADIADAMGVVPRRVYQLHHDGVETLAAQGEDGGESAS